jgi:8-oxo-dGTP pyrophosphatase MutT (NUDIX family)
MPSDVSWQAADGRFDLRVAAIITRGDSVLVCTVPTAGCWFLPGGRARLGEASDVALVRELAEELGHELPAGQLVLVVENIYGKDGELRHEIGLYYYQEWPSALPPGDIHGGTEPEDEFRWVALSDLEATGFQPAGIISLLPERTGAVRHVSLDQRTGTVLVDGRPSPR